MKQNYYRLVRRIRSSQCGRGRRDGRVPLSVEDSGEKIKVPSVGSNT
jgi:hypothetical protein